jgi:hypothetical protein
METGNAKHTIHLIDLTADHYFGERQAKHFGKHSTFCDLRGGATEPCSHLGARTAPLHLFAVACAATVTG